MDKHHKGDSMIRYVHTNIIAQDWEKLADFYINVFGCRLKPPRRNLKGDWLSKASGVENAELKGAHLLLPGYGDDGPTLEIFSYSEMGEKEKSLANRKGLRHIAFRVDDVVEMFRNVLESSGSPVGEVVTQEVSGVGILTFAYVYDPEGNIIELQSWKMP